MAPVHHYLSLERARPIAAELEASVRTLTSHRSTLVGMTLHA
jgi:hypothetical protein